MNTLFDNAIWSIQLGLEDFKSNDPKRPLSAVRNFYAGLLLLAKEAIVRSAPDEDAKLLLAVKVDMRLSDEGKVVFEADGHRSIDFEGITARLSRFNIRVEKGLLTQLNRIRNDIEHAHTQATQEAVRESIAKSFPVLVTLFRQMGLDPAEELGETWSEMREAKEIYEAELEECRATLNRIKWNPEFLRSIPHLCPECDSKLVEQLNKDNDDFQSARFQCRQCGSASHAETLFPYSLGQHFSAESYIAMTDGGDQPVDTCNECGLDTYVIDESFVGCCWCGTQLDECARCYVGLNPSNVSSDNSSLCGYCANLMSKDD
jgi:hypothetical protein